MRTEKLLLVPLFLLIIFVAVILAGDAETSKTKRRIPARSEETLSSVLDHYFKGNVKKSLEQLFTVNEDSLKARDKFADVEERLKKTEEILYFKKALFEKEKEAGIQAGEILDDKITEETLSELQSTVEKLKEEKVELFEQFETAEIFRKLQLNLVAETWINDKIDEPLIDEMKSVLGDIYEMAKKKADMRKMVKNNFDRIMETLVERYEKTIYEKTEKHDDNIRKELIQDRIEFKKHHNYLYDNNYYLINLTLSDRPLQKENVLIEVIDNILKYDPHDLLVQKCMPNVKKLVEKLVVTAKWLKDYIPNSSACSFTKEASLESKYVYDVSMLGYKFEAGVLKIIDNLVSSPSQQEKLSSRIRMMAEKYHDVYQRLVEYFNKMEQCKETWFKSLETVTKAKRWERNFR